MSYHHGVRVVEINSGTRPIRTAQYLFEALEAILRSRGG